MLQDNTTPIMQAAQQTQLIPELIPPPGAIRYLNYASVFWFITIATGQLIFVLYLLLFYVQSALLGQFETWNKVLPRGYVPGDSFGNTAVASHIFISVVIMTGGLIQLIPGIRARMPVLHRWNGRIYLVLCVITSLFGLYMVWSKSSSGVLMRHIGISLDALLIILFAGLTLRYALARKIAQHRRWALRLFIAVSAVWFFRVGLMFWIFINKGPVGFDIATFRGPFLSFLSFADYLIPLALLEIYLRAKDSHSSIAKVLCASLIVLATLAMGLGIFVATMGLWLPRMSI